MFSLKVNFFHKSNVIQTMVEVKLKDPILMDKQPQQSMDTKYTTLVLYVYLSSRVPTSMQKRVILPLVLNNSHSENA